MRDCVAKCRRRLYRVSTFDLTLQYGMWPSCPSTINHCLLIIALGLLRCDIKHAFVIFCFVLFVLVIPCVYFVIYYTCRTIVIFGTLKDDSLEINILAVNNCFSHRNIFQNSVNTLSTIFVKKLKFFYSSNCTILFKFHQHVVQILIK